MMELIFIYFTGNKMTGKKYLVSGSIGMIVLIAAIMALSPSDYKKIIKEMPGDTAVVQYSTGAADILTKSSVCDYVLFKISKDDMKVKCGSKSIVTAKWNLEYQRLGKWVKLAGNKGESKIEVIKGIDGYTIKKTTPYYATASKTGSAGDVTETYDVSADRIKSSLEFKTSYTNRMWRATWTTNPYVDVIEDAGQFMQLDKNVRITFSDDLFEKRIDNVAFYKEQPGSFKIDPVLQFGNSSTHVGAFFFGSCTDCVNGANVSFSSSSSAFTATYESGWEFSKNIRQIENMTMQCDTDNGGYCEITIRNGTEIIPTNDSDTIERCLFNGTRLCSGGRNIDGANYSYFSGAINNFEGLLINDSDTAFLRINDTCDECGLGNATIYGTNYTINMSQGYLDMMITFK